MRKNDTIGGAALVGFAGAYAFAASDLSFTSSLGIGPGLFPMVLAVLLALIGAWIAVKGYVSEPEDRADEAIPLRGLIMIAAGPVLFGILVVPFGVVPALIVAIFVSAMASPSMSIPSALISAAVLTVFCVVLFRWALDLPLPLFGSRLSFG